MQTENEKLLTQWLSQYGPLPKVLITQLMKLEDAYAERLFRKVRRRGLAIEDSTKQFICPDEYCKPDSKTIRALWVFLHFMDQVAPMCHTIAHFPAQLLFVKGEQNYEIIVLEPGEEHLTVLLHADEGTRYIFVLADISMAQRLKLPDAPCLFATIDDDSPTPIVHFFSEGGTA